MAKVTLITQWFPPEPAYLWKDLAVELQNFGHEVTVITAFPNYPTGKIYKGYKQSLTHVEEIDGVKVIRLPVYPDRSSSFIKRGASYMSFALSVAFVGAFRIPKSDIYLCYSPPLTVGFIVSILASIRRVPFILNIQDLWPDTLISTGMMREGFVTKMIGRSAKWVYKRSKGIVVLSEGFKNHLVSLGVDESKVAYISNWSSENNLALLNNNSSNNHRMQFGINENDKVITFAGNLGPAQGLETVIDVAEILRDHSQIKFLFVGDGMSLESLKESVANKKLTNVIFAGRVNYCVMDEIYEASDVLLIHLKKDPLFEITIPHKLLTYLSTGKPIVAAVDGEVNNIVKSSNSGFFSKSEDASGIAKNIISACNLTNIELNFIKSESNSFFNKHFAKKVLIKKWDNLITQCTS